MKYCTFKFNGHCRIGAKLDNYIVDIQRALALYLSKEEKDRQADEIARVFIPEDFLEFLDAGKESWEAAKTAYEYVKKIDKNVLGINEEFIFYPLDNVKLTVPYRPRTLICAGPGLEDPQDKQMHNYVEFFLKSTHTVTGPEEPIYFDQKYTGKLSCQPELALVVGKKGRFISEGNILDHVFGYTVLNNVYSVDRLVIGWEGTMFHVRYGEGASFDNSAPIGPWIVTTDEIKDPENLILKKYINDELVNEASTSSLFRSVRQFASYCSTFFTLQPDIMISTGNPSGPVLGKDEFNRPVIKHLKQNSMYLKPGDKVKCEIEGVGCLRNLVVKLSGGGDK